ncbi:MAG: hypothetical protein ACOC2D_12875, partial [Spirochaetota bacterium]
ETPAPVAIRDVAALYENIAPSFWSASSARREYRLFLNVWVDLELEPRAERLVDEIRLHDPFGSHWSIPFDRAELAERGGVGGWLRLFDTYMSDNGSMLPLRGMTLQVELSDGRVVSHVVDVPPPASSTPDERFLVSEEYRGELTADHAFAIERASIQSAAFRSGSVRVVFGPVDPRATNGRLVLLDGARELVGESPTFSNDMSREPRAFLNDGSRLRSGHENLVELGFEQMAWQAGRSADEAVFVYVLLRDGGQFAFTGRSGEYTHASRSAPFELGAEGGGGEERQ